MSNSLLLALKILYKERHDVAPHAELAAWEALINLVAENTADDPAIPWIEPELDPFRVDYQDGGPNAPWRRPDPFLDATSEPLGSEPPRPETDEVVELHGESARRAEEILAKHEPYAVGSDGPSIEDYDRSAQFQAPEGRLRFSNTGVHSFTFDTPDGEDERNGALDRPRLVNFQGNLNEDGILAKVRRNADFNDPMREFKLPPTLPLYAERA